MDITGLAIAAAGEIVSDIDSAKRCASLDEAKEYLDRAQVWARRILESGAAAARDN